MYLTLLLALFMILGWGYTGTSWMIYSVITILSLGIIFDKHEKKIVYLFFVLPWAFVIGLRFYATLALVYFCTIVINSFIKGKRKSSIKAWMSVLLFLSITLVSMLFGESDLTNAILFYSCMSVFIALTINGEPHIDVSETTRVLTFSLIISCVIGLLLNKFPYFFNIIKVYDLETVTSYYRFTGLDGDPNFLSFFIMMSISGISVLLFYETKKKMKVIYYITLILLIIFGLLTFSKTFIVVGFLYLTSYVLLATKGKKRIRYTVFLITTLIVSSILFAPLMSFISEGYSYRATKISQDLYDNPISALTSGRSDLWKIYLLSWSESSINILFGKGNMAREFFTSHNTLIRLLYMFGLFGLLSFILMIIEYCRQVYYKKKISKYYINYIPIFVFILYTSVLDMFRGNAISYLFPFIILLINYMIYTKNSLQKV